MHRRKLGLLVGGLVAAIALTGSSSAVAGQTAAEQKVGGTVLFGQDQEPRTLNSWVIEGNLLATREVYNALFGRKRGTDAFYAMVSLQRGDFAVDPSFVATERVIDESPEGLLLEGMRRLDEGLPS